MFDMLKTIGRTCLAGATLSTILTASSAAYAGPACSSLPAPFPCGQGTHPVCIKREPCIDGAGLVPKTKTVCTMTSCVNNPPKPVPQNTQAKPNKLNPQPEPPGRTK